MATKPIKPDPIQRARLDSLADTLVDVLPHGSGIDTSWEVEQLKNGSIVATCSYHGMDENGFYDGWQNFRVIIRPIAYDIHCPQCKGTGKRSLDEIAAIRHVPPNSINRDELNVEWIDDGKTQFRCNVCHGETFNPDILEFNVYLSGYRQSPHKSWVYGLKEYLEETIHWSIHENLKLFLVHGVTNG